jgi:cell division protein FtsI (penicillin-binding protein 3)/stage V sporulation protein D (sporulation-specific penicillin-binding protein)
VALCVLLLCLMAGRAVWIGTVRAGSLDDLGASQRTRSYELTAPRGILLSRDGQELAVNRPSVTVSATPRNVVDPARTAARLAPLLRMDRAALEERLSRRSQYEPLARNVTPDRADRIKALRLPGIDFTDTMQRFAPRGRTAAQVIGLADDFGSGLSGLEKVLDARLTGKPGQRIEVHDPFGRPLRVLANRDPVPGESVKLTLDARIQEITQRVLAETRATYGAKTASAIVMRPSDGAIYAMATVPSFNPNDRRKIDAELERNRPVTDLFEPGSTFKLVTVAGALEEGLVTPDSMFDLPKVLKIYDLDLKDAEERPHVVWPVKEILAKSSNIGTVKIAQRLGQARLLRWIDRFGFGHATGIDFPGEVPGSVLPAEQWSGVTIANMPIGQGIAVTMAQLVRAYAAVANGGYLVTPYLVAGDRGRRERVLTSRTARIVNRMLRRVVSDEGTGSGAALAGFEVAGKTGTAQKIDDKTGKYASRYVASFVGFVPADKPKLLVAVVVDDPSGGLYYGGEVAAPAFAQIAQGALSTLGIAP